MKKLLCMLLGFFLPLCALAEAPLTLISDSLIHQTGGDISILRHVELPDGDVLLDGCVQQSNFDRTGPGGWIHLYLMRVDAQGKLLWETRYSSTLETIPYDKSVLSVDKDSVSVMHYSGMLGNEHCQMTEMRFDLATGKQLEGPDTCSISVVEVPTITHSGDFRIEEYFGDYSGETARTLVTYIPTGRTAEYELDGQRTYHAFGDKLMCFRSGMQDGGRYWVFDANCLPIIEAAEAPFGSVNPMVGHSAQGKDMLYLFVWTNRQNPDQRTYTVFPMDKNLKIGEALTSFTLSEGHSLGTVAACGDGFVLTDLMPWEWGVVTTCDLVHLSADGTMTVLTEDLPEQRSTVTLLPGIAEGQLRVLLRDEAGTGLRQLVYADE